MGRPNPWACVSDFVQHAAPTQTSKAQSHPPSSTTSCLSKMPLHLCPLSHLPSLDHHWPPSLLYKMARPNPWACVSDFVQQACPTPANTPARPSQMHQVPPHPTCQSYPSTLHLCPLSHLPTLGHHWPPSLLYKMGGPDGRTVPDWLVVPDSAQPNAWHLLHYAGKGGARFSVGSTSRYPPGQEADAAHKAKEYQFQALHKIYFYVAWRSQPELGTRGSDLHLPPQPGLLQAGCYCRSKALPLPSMSARVAPRLQHENRKRQVCC